MFKLIHDPHVGSKRLTHMIIVVLREDIAMRKTHCAYCGRKITPADKLAVQFYAEGEPNKPIITYHSDCVNPASVQKEDQ